MLTLLPPNLPDAPFPDPALAEEEPNGLLAVGGDLSAARLLRAYRRGIFPWYGRGQPILWWSPDPRLVLFPERLRVSRSLRKRLRQRRFVATFDRAFESVIRGCAAPRQDTTETWLVAEMIAAYCALHRSGHAHSIEVWSERGLAGGLYGIAIGGVFFGESMFARETDASKVALVNLVNFLRQWDFRLIDCQVYSEHLCSMGAEEISRALFLKKLEAWCALPGRPGSWEGIAPLHPTRPEETRG